MKAVQAFCNINYNTFIIITSSRRFFLNGLMRLVKQTTSASIIRQLGKAWRRPLIIGCDEAVKLHHEFLIVYRAL